MKLLIGCLLAVGVCNAEILEPKASVRVLPADVLRDFNGTCFAATQCRIFNVGESWELTPFCGISKCVRVIVKSGPGASDRPQIAEQVTDCGPRVDLDKSPGCKEIKEEVKEGEKPIAKSYPDCCPKFDCENPEEVVYLQAAKTTKITQSPGKKSPKSLDE